MRLPFLASVFVGGACLKMIFCGGPTNRFFFGAGSFSVAAGVLGVEIVSELTLVNSASRKASSSSFFFDFFLRCVLPLFLLAVFFVSQSWALRLSPTEILCSSVDDVAEPAQAFLRYS